MAMQAIGLTAASVGYLGTSVSFFLPPMDFKITEIPYTDIKIGFFSKFALSGALLYLGGKSLEKLRDDQYIGNKTYHFLNVCGAAGSAFLVHYSQHLSNLTPLIDQMSQHEVQVLKGVGLAFAGVALTSPYSPRPIRNFLEHFGQHQGGALHGAFRA